MNYKFENLKESDVVLIGKALGKMTIEEGADLHQRLQAQIFEQEQAERERVTTEQNAAVAAWRATEIEKLKGELPKAAKTASRKKG